MQIKVVGKPKPVIISCSVCSTKHDYDKPCPKCGNKVIN